MTRMKLRKIIRYPRLMLWALWMEGLETKQMLHTFARQGKGVILFSTQSERPTPEEMKKAYEQLKDLPRMLPFFILVVMPAPGVTEGYTILAITLEKWLGHRFRLLPNQFRKIFQKAKEEGSI
jgi:hypothetical protein